MGKVAFLPWLNLEKDFEAGAFHLLRYRRGETPGRDEAEQILIDQVLSAYRDSSGQPINRATILRHFEQESPAAAIDESFHIDFFVFADLLAFAGLAARRFLGHFEYSNRDNYRSVLQEFTDPQRGVLVTARRRDGSSNMFFSGDTFVEYRPYHVGFDRVKIDRSLLGALLSATSHQDWPRIYQAILLFNEANTDRLEIPVGTELILTYAALVQVLDMAGRPPAEVADRFSEVVSPREPLPSKEWRIARGNHRAETLLERSPNLRTAWLKDLGISRGSVAHGHAAEAYPACWHPHEHLLLGAHVVPLVMKLHLHDLGLYELTADDVGGIEVFELLLNEDHFSPPDADDCDEDDKHPWLRIIDHERIRRLAERMAAEFFRDQNAAF